MFFINFGEFLSKIIRYENAVSSKGFTKPCPELYKDYIFIKSKTKFPQIHHGFAQKIIPSWTKRFLGISFLCCTEFIWKILIQQGTTIADIFKTYFLKTIMSNIHLPRALMKI